MTIAVLFLVCLMLIGVGVVLDRLSALRNSADQAYVRLTVLERSIARIDEHTTPPPEPDPGTVQAELQARLKRLESGRAILRQRLAARGIKVPPVKPQKAGK